MDGKIGSIARARSHPLRRFDEAGALARPWSACPWFPLSTCAPRRLRRKPGPTSFVVFTGRPEEPRTVRDDDFDLLTDGEARSIADELAARTAISEETASATD